MITQRTQSPVPARAPVNHHAESAEPRSARALVNHHAENAEPRPDRALVNTLTQSSRSPRSISVKRLRRLVPAREADSKTA